MNCELPGVQAGFRKGRGTRDLNKLDLFREKHIPQTSQKVSVASECGVVSFYELGNFTGWIMEKAREFQKHIYFCFIA